MPSTRDNHGRPLAQEKTALRRELRARRAEIAPAKARRAAEQAAGHLASDPRWPAAGNVALYLPSDGELDTGPIAALADSSGRQLFLPRLTGDQLEFAPWAAGEPLRENRFGIGEPTTEAAGVTTLDLLVLPLVAVGRDGMRLGMGGGFYDRTLGAVAAEERPLLLGLAYEFQFIDAVPAQPWDIALDAVLTETGLWPTSRAD